MSNALEKFTPATISPAPARQLWLRQQLLIILVTVPPATIVLIIIAPLMISPCTAEIALTTMLPQMIIVMAAIIFREQFLLEQL